MHEAVEKADRPGTHPSAAARRPGEETRRPAVTGRDRRTAEAVRAVPGRRRGAPAGEGEQDAQRQREDHRIGREVAVGERRGRRSLGAGPPQRHQQRRPPRRPTANSNHARTPPRRRHDVQTHQDGEDDGADRDQHVRSGGQGRAGEDGSPSARGRRRARGTSVRRAPGDARSTWSGLRVTPPVSAGSRGQVQPPPSRRAPPGTATTAHGRRGSAVRSGARTR